jgi:hypothetical protein
MMSRKLSDTRPALSRVLEVLAEIVAKLHRLNYLQCPMKFARTSRGSAGRRRCSLCTPLCGIVH